MDVHEALRLPRYICRIDYGRMSYVSEQEKRIEGLLVRIVGSTQTGVPEDALIKVEFIYDPEPKRLISPAFLVKDEQDQQKLV